MKSVYLFCFFIITAVNMRVLAFEQNKVSSLSVEKGFADSSNNKLSFYENKGQIKNLSDGSNNSDVKFYLQNKNLNVYLLSSGIAYQFNHLIYPEGYNADIKGLKPDEMEKQLEFQNKVKLETYRMDMQLKGANPNAHITTEGRSSDYINYYNHDVLDVHSYSKIIYHDVYPKIDWVIYTNKTVVKYDFVVHPGGDPSMIQLDFKDQEKIHLDEVGNLIIENRLGRITEQKPVSIQNEKEIGTDFNLIEDILGFKIGKYEKGQDLIIDPCIGWATYYGGVLDDDAQSCAIDLNGNVYICGTTSSSANIASGGFKISYSGGGYDAFLVKFNSSGTRLWSTYYGGTGSDGAKSCVSDASGNVYLCGSTSSTSGIASGGLQINYNGGGSDAFLVKFSSSGLRIWATYYGGSLNDAGNGCAIDNSGNVFLCGFTNSTTNIASGGFQNSYGGGANDAFLVKFNSSGTRSWATYFGGSLNDQGKSCAIDIYGNVFLCGYTNSITNIASGGFQNSYGGGTNDAFLVKFSASCTRTWSTYYGGASEDLGASCVYIYANVYLCGTTSSTSNIASGGFQNTFGGGSNDAFLVKFNSSGARQWATYYGGSGFDGAASCASDKYGNILFCGSTSSTNSIATSGSQNIYGGGFSDAFLVKFSPSCSRIWASYYGGVANDYGYSCLFDGYGYFMSGATNTNYVFWNGGHQSVLGGGNDAFLQRVIFCVGTTVRNVTACDFYIGSNRITYNSGTFYDTLKNIFKEDSLIVKLNLSVKKSTSNTINKTACARYFWNNKYIYTSGIYYDTLINKAGCDSFLTLNLFVNSVVRTNYSISNCKYYKWRNKYLTKPGLYIDTFNSYKGCDSIVTINLQIKSYAYVYDTTLLSNCNPITWKNKTISNTNVYYDTVAQILDNCDLIHVLFFKRLASNIVKQPFSKYIYKDQIAEFSVLIQNPNSKFQWQGNNNNGSNWFNLFDAGPYSGAQSNTLKVKDINGYLNDRAFRCIVSDNNCTETSNVSSLNICPQIIQQPIDRYSGLNSHVYFDVKVDLENANYQWQINKGSGFEYLQNDSIFNGVKTSHLDVYIKDKSQENYQFRCIVNKSACLDTTIEVKLHLLDKINPNPCNSQSLSSVYPNPTNDFITLLVPSNLVGKEYKIANEIGVEIMNGIITKEESKISIKDYAAGVYFLRVGYEGLDCFKIIKLNE